MKAELKFTYDTENYDERKEIETMQNAQKFKSILWDLDQELRQILKYDDSKSEEVKEELQKFRDGLWAKVREEGVDLE